MNHTFRLTLALLVGVTVGLSAQTATRWDMFELLSWEGRLAFLNQPPTTPWDEEFLLRALDLDDSDRIESGTDKEVTAKTSAAVRLVRLLAALPSAKAAPAIARLPLQYRDPELRGESWLALAQLGDRTVISTLVRTLTSLNDSAQRGRGEEIQAAYAVQALGVLKAPEAFRAVAAASMGWYTPVSGVRALAKKTLPLLVPDYSRAMVALLASDEELILKEGLFESIADQTDAAFTAEAAAAVLGPLVRYQARDKADQDRTVRLTLATLVAAQKAPAPPVAFVAPIEVLLTRNDSTQVLVQGVRLLGRIGDASSLNLLTVTLASYNAKQKGGTNTPADIVVVRELFSALAATGKKEARTSLDEARYSDYSATVVKDAVAALSQLPQ